MDTQLKPARRKTSSPPPPAPDPAPENGEGAVMGFFDHLGELRTRLVRASAAILITTLLALFFADRILLFLLRPYSMAAPEGEIAKLQILGPTEGVVVFFRVALLAGAILSLPLITYQLWQFIAPGLTRKERRWVYWSIPATTGLFFVGVVFAWFILIPAAIGFLSDFQSDIFLTEWTADQYIAFVTSLIFWIGLAFEMPLIFFILSRIGMVGPRALWRNWRLAAVGSAVLAAIITPTIDPFNMLLVMGPLLALYGLSIGLTAIGFRRSGVGPV